MSERMTIRVAGPLAQELVAAGIAQPIVSERRADALDLAVQVGIAIKEVSSVILAVAGGIQGFRAILDWLQGAEPEEEIVVTVIVSEEAQSWTVGAAGFDDQTKMEMIRTLEEAERAEVDAEAATGGTPPDLP